MAIIDRWIVKLLGSSQKLCFLVFLYERYVPERRNISDALWLSFNFFAKFSRIVLNSEMIMNAFVATIKKANRLKIICSLIVTIVEKIIGTSSGYLVILFRPIMPVYKRLFFSFSPQHVERRVGKEFFVSI